MTALLTLTLLASQGLAQGEREPVRFSAEPAELQAPSGKRYALIIGVDEYEDPAISSLRFTANDAEAMAAALIASGLYTEHTVTLMTPDSPRRLKPTRNNILEQVTRLSEAPDAEQVLFFFSGHGMGVSEGGLQQNMLMPMDARFITPADSSVSLTRLYAILSASEAEQKVVIIDACRNEITQGGKGGAGRFADVEMPAGQGTMILYSTKFDGVSWEDEGRGLGVMTARLLEGLEGGANADGDAWITVTEAFEYTIDAVWGWSSADGRLQVPFIAGERTGEFVLTSAATDWTPPPPPPELEREREGGGRGLQDNRPPPEPLLSRVGGLPAAVSYSGAVVTGATSAALWGAALREKGAYYTDVAEIEAGTVAMHEIDNPDETAARANGLGYAAQATTGLALGLAATGLVFTFVIDEAPLAGRVRFTGSGLQLTF